MSSFAGFALIAYITRKTHDFWMSGNGGETLGYRTLHFLNLEAGFNINVMQLAPAVWQYLM